MSRRNPRLAVRAIIMQDQRLLMVNAWADHHGSDLWCAPGGGVESGQDLPTNLIREVHEETGLTVSVGALALVNEFHDPARTFHQVDLFYRCQITGGQIDDNWRDPENIVSRRRFFSYAELVGLHLRPKALPDVAFSAVNSPVVYDPLEEIIF